MRSTYPTIARTRNRLKVMIVKLRPIRKKATRVRAMKAAKVMTALAKAKKAKIMAKEKTTAMMAPAKVKKAKIPVKEKITAKKVKAVNKISWVL